MEHLCNSCKREECYGRDMYEHVRRMMKITRPVAPNDYEQESSGPDLVECSGYIGVTKNS